MVRIFWKKEISNSLCIYTLRQGRIYSIYVTHNQAIFLDLSKWQLAGQKMFSSKNLYNSLNVVEIKQKRFPWFLPQ